MRTICLVRVSHRHDPQNMLCSNALQHPAPPKWRQRRTPSGWILFAKLRGKKSGPQSDAISLIWRCAGSRRGKSERREIRTPNLLIWSQTRYRCAIHPMLAIATSAKETADEAKSRFTLYACVLLVANRGFTLAANRISLTTGLVHVLAPLA